MEILELATLLGKTIKEDERVQKMQEATKAYESNEALQAQIAEYNAQSAALTEEYRKEQKDQEMIDAIQAAGLIPQMHGPVSGILLLVGGLELLALGTWLYMKSALGSGPRDALMVALARKFNRSAGACRAVVDVLVTVIGFFLGGPVGVGTIISAVGLGPLINLNFAAVRFRPAEVHQENVAETIQRIAGN